MKIHCPECGDKYKNPQPDNFLCGDCLFHLSLLAVIKTKKPIKVINERR